MNNKRNLSLIILLFLCTSVLIAQEWQTSFEKAKEIASEHNQQIILVFQGSDWCAPCIKLDREIWSTTQFQDYAKKNYVMLQADFPRKKQNALSKLQASANAQLAEIYNSNGIFPLVVVLDQNGKVLGETSYKKTSVTTYIDLLNAFVRP